MEFIYLILATKQSRHPEGICGKAKKNKQREEPAAGPRPVSYNI